MDATASPQHAPDDMFALVTRALNVAYYEWAPESDEIRISQALRDLFGYEPEIFTLSALLGFMLPDDRARFRDEMTAFFKGSAERASTDYRVLSPAGEIRWVHDRKLAQRDANGRVTRVVGAVSDITEAKRREAENRAQIARQAASIEVLKTISASPDDPQPVFELIARRARELCGAAQSSVTEFDGALLHMRAQDGFDPATKALARQHWPQPPNTANIAGRIALGGRVIHIRDLSTDVDYGTAGHEVARSLGSRSLLGYRCCARVG